MIIYKTTNLINGNFYIGKDTHNNPNYLGSGLLLKRAIKKYGKENFKKEILQYCNTITELNNAEKYWILELKATQSYNIALGGDGGNTLLNHPELESIKAKQRGRISWWKGKTRPNQIGLNNSACRPEVRRKISASKKGISRPDMTGDLNPARKPEVKEKISLKLKGKSKPKIQCPHCGLEGQPPNMNRWHFDNCKMTAND